MKSVNDVIKIILTLYQDNFVKNVQNTLSQMQIEQHAFLTILFYQRKVLIIYYFSQGLINIVLPKRIFTIAIKIKL